MTLHEWIAEERARLDRFEAYWLKYARLKENEEMFPMSMGAGEWDEQFRFFEE